MTGGTERSACLVCGQLRAVNADGRLRKHPAKGGGGVCRGSGRPTNALLDVRDRELATLRKENAALRRELATLRKSTDIASVWAELTTEAPSGVEAKWLREFDSFGEKPL